MHKKYHTVYKTTNLINGKCYVGVHSTNKQKDEYIGSGNLIKHAIAKYGKDNFKKEILHVFKTRDEALEKEKEIVNKSFVDDSNTYNLIIGGGGGKCVNSMMGQCRYCKRFFKFEKLNRLHNENCRKHPKGGYRYMAYDGPPEHPPQYIDGNDKRLTKRRRNYLEKIRAFYGIDFGL